MKVKPQVIVAALAIAFLAVSPAGGAPATPVHTAPVSGAGFDGVPAMAWNAVAGAYRYEFQLSADPGFNSTQESYFTRNTRATVDENLTNGTYWWRVRADDGAGSVSPWSTPTSFVLNWGSAPTLAAPAEGATVVYPTTPLTLKWNPTPRAVEYRLELATDPALGSSVASRYPFETEALEFTPPELLAPGTYYWAVTPIDARGNIGTRSAVRSFVWSWPSTTTPTVTDLSSAPEVYDPLFAWDRVPGAARYEVEVNSTAAFTPAAKVCCSGTTISLSLAPTEVFLDNVYYWRIRAFDPSGNAGVWNEGPSFDKRFDKVPPVTAPSVKNVRMRDHLVDPGTDVDGAAAGYQTNMPIVTWDQVPGAASYHIEVAPYTSGVCDYGASILNKWSVTTAVNAWTPLGSGGTAGTPFPPPVGLTVSKDSAVLQANQPYCARVRARSSHVGSVTVWGDFTTLNDGTGAAFEWEGPPATSACSPSCNAGYLGADDYLEPVRGSTVGGMPLYTWEPLDGRASYWVIVSKDSNFSNIVDYAFTQLPAYAPRENSGIRTYADETTHYYVAVLPAIQSNGGLAASDPLAAEPSTFIKQTDAPTLISPAEGATVADQPTFRWTPSEGARYYVLQVAQDPTFSDPIHEVNTPSLAYASNSTYPADTVLYWRVRPADADQLGLTWSAPGTFQKTLASPVLDPSNPTNGDLIPTIKWSPVPGAVSYDFHFELPDSFLSSDANGVAATAVTLVEMSGTGVFRWQVRANFPKQGFGVTHGPWTPLANFTRTIGEPQSPASDAGQNRLLLTWDPKVGAKEYRVQISQRTDFAPYVEQATVDQTNFASKFVSSSYAAGGTFYWRVAAMDDHNNVGDYTTTRSFTMPPLTQQAGSGGGGGTTPTTQSFSLSSTGRLVRRQYRTVTIYVRNTNSTPVYQASVRASGAGITARTKLTSTTGVVKFRLRPSQLSRVTFRVSKSGYFTKYLYKRVYAR